MAKVGRSSRTPFKHWVLNLHLGQIAGVLSHRSLIVPAKPNPFLCVDLCAGDGTESDAHQASPKIITKHCDWLAGRGFDVRSVFYEKHSATFESLEANMGATNERHVSELFNCDAAEFVFVPECTNQAVFINCDPNSIAELPLSRTLAESLTPTTTITMTLGCNVGGLKRLSLEKRMEWFEYIDIMLSVMPSWHDAILVAIENDSAQWAYFTRLPAKWSHKNTTELQKRGDSMFPHGVRVESVRHSRAGFDDLVKRLFHTKGELQND